jgi:hypothetical protein
MAFATEAGVQGLNFRHGILSIQWEIARVIDMSRLWKMNEFAFSLILMITKTANETKERECVPAMVGV